MGEASPSEYNKELTSIIEESKAWFALEPSSKVHVVFTKKPGASIAGAVENVIKTTIQGKQFIIRVILSFIGWIEMGADDIIFLIVPSRELDCDNFSESAKKYFRKKNFEYVSTEKGLGRFNYWSFRHDDKTKLLFLGPFSFGLECEPNKIIIEFPSGLADVHIQWLPLLLEDFIDWLGDIVDIAVGGAIQTLDNYGYATAYNPNYYWDQYKGRLELLVYPFWLYYLSKENVARVGEEIVLNAPAWAVKRVGNGVLLQNGPVPNKSVSDNSAACKEVSDYFRKVLEVKK